MTAKEIKLTIKVAKGYREVSYGQYDQETYSRVPEMDELVSVSEHLLDECEQRRRDFNNLMVFLQTSRFKAPDYAEVALQRMNASGI